MDNKQDKTYAGMTRRTLCLGAGGAAVMLGLGGLKYVGSQPIVRPAGRTGRRAPRLRLHPLREVLRDLPAQRHRARPPRRRRAEHAHANVRLLCQLVRLVRRRARRHPAVRQRLPHRSAQAADGATAENTIIGKAVINTDWCLAYKLIGCRFCYDACPYEAMELDENNRPVVIEDKCNGCGACESVCVSLQNGSISEGATARAIVVHPLEEVEG